ncbi:MAG TPA: hypothetical protein VGS13_09930 [Stellaceae bacterium]|nr:hypothetical protein [Stellaceae bacterium]
MSKQADPFLFRVMAGLDPAIGTKLHEIPGSSPGMTIEMIELNPLPEVIC